MNIWRATLLLSLTTTTLAHAATVQDLAAGPVQMATCPAISDDFAKVLADLAALKTSIIATANCSDVGTKVDDFAGVAADRDQFLALIQKSQTTTLTAAEAAEVSNYAAAVTEKAAALIDLITGSNQCFKDNGDQQLLTSISGIVSEATTLITSVAGPWGAPIAVGGQVISGLITGLDKVLKSRAGFNFSDRAQWTAYVQNLCTYTNLRPSIEALLHPETRISQLQAIGRKLDQNMANVTVVCPDCAAVTATPLGALSLRIRNAQAWVKSETQRVQDDSNAMWNNVTGKYVLSQAQREMESFLLGMEGPKFLNYQLAQSQKSFSDLAQYLFDQGTPLLHQAHVAGLISSEPPLDSIMTGIDGSAVDIPNGNGADKYAILAGTDWRALYQTQNRPDDDLEYRLINGRNLSMEKFDTASWAFGVDYQFCDFFIAADLYSSPLQNACTSTLYKTLTSTVSEMTASTSTPSWKQSHEGVIRAADWTQALDIWSSQVQTAVTAK